MYKMLDIHVLCFPIICPSQWVKVPLLDSRYRGVCEKPSMDIWKCKVSNKLPAHLCACALLGRVIGTATVVPYDQNKANYPSHLPNLKHTGKQTHDMFYFLV